MKIVRLSHGLGNAMFQYCIYLQLKKMYKDEKIYVDTSFYKLTDYPNELPKVLGSSLEAYDINEEFIKDKNYLEKLDKLRYWRKLGCNDFMDIFRGDNKKIYGKLDSIMSYIELPLLYKEKFSDLKIVSPNKEKMEDIIDKFLNDKNYLNVSKFITVKHTMAEFINKRLEGEIKLKYNLFRNPDIRKRLIKQLLGFNRLDWCHYGNSNLLPSFGDTYYNIYGDPCNLEGIEGEVRTAFCFSKFEDKNNIKMADKIVTTESVALHARVIHFDYGIKEALERNYYKKAVSYIKNNINKPISFFVFSDNIDWCRNNLNSLGLSNEDVTFVDFNKSENSFRDMQLMSLCKHIVIANSTFSWWAGVLIKNPDKIFITPYGSWPGTISF